jgi:UDPglucose 6-dehydrogenase
MNIAVIGSGYVGLVTAACFAEMGNSVICMDLKEDRVAKLAGGAIPIYEPGLEPIVRANLSRGTLNFTTDLGAALAPSQVCFIAVGTPMGEDGHADMQFVMDCAKEIGSSMEHDLVIVDKSTVPVGTAEKVGAVIARQLAERGASLAFTVVSNPEFLKEGTAIKDFMSPERVVIGVDDQGSLEVMRELYRPFTLNHERLIVMDVRSAEMTKYAANAMLATKISFINEIANICDIVGADVNKVRLGIGSDSRIGYNFLYPGCGYGGSCFPKDVRALEKTALDHGYEARILRAVQGVNDSQKYVIVKKIVARFGENLKGFSFAIWGLAFKPETDDMREAPSIVVIGELVRRGAIVKAYDPKACNDAQACYLKDLPGISYCQSKSEALSGADSLVLLTEWREFRMPDFNEMRRLLKSPIVFDGRNLYDSQRLRELGFEYYHV